MNDKDVRLDLDISKKGADDDTVESVENEKKNNTTDKAAPVEDKAAKPAQKESKLTTRCPDCLLKAGLKNDDTLCPTCNGTGLI